jgi:hypothetical protein
MADIKFGQEGWGLFLLKNGIVTIYRWEIEILSNQDIHNTHAVVGDQTI